MPLALGIVGIITGLGLLRLCPWARISAIAWAIGSPLACLYLLAHPAFQSGFQLSAPAVSLLMLFLLPINAGWLFLFFRAGTRKLFGPSGMNASPEGVSRYSQWNVMSEPPLPPDFPK